MKHKYYVRHNGVLYAPGTDVPEGVAPVDEEPKVEVEPTAEPEVEPDEEPKAEVEPEYTRTQIQQMNSSDLKATASKLDIDFNEDVTNRELKQMILDKLGM